MMLFTTLFTFILSSVTFAETNIAPNGSFEGGSGGTASDWTNGTNMARVSDKAHDGTYSLKSTRG